MSQWDQWIKIGGSEDLAQESPAQDPSLGAFLQPDYLQLPTAASQSLKFWNE